MKSERAILAERLAAAGAAVMPKHQAKRFASVVHGQRRDTTPQLPPVTTDRPFRPMPFRRRPRAKPVEPRQGVLL